MKRILLILLIITFSCAERELQLPVTTNNDITEILDVSPIYLFYDDETGEADFNRKNMISTTNWLVNIDKRLTLKQVLPHLQYLQEKRKGDGMHKNENARNYFTCFNEETKNLSFIEFTDYVFTDSLTLRNLVTKLPNFPKENQLISVDFHSNENINLIVNSTQNSFNFVKANISNIEKKIDSLIKINLLTKEVSLRFSDSLAFQSYITFITMIRNLDDTNLDINNVQLIDN